MVWTSSENQSLTSESLFGLLLAVLQLLHDLALMSGRVVSVGVVTGLLLAPAFPGRALCEQDRVNEQNSCG